MNRESSIYLDAIPVFDWGHHLISHYRKTHGQSYRDTIRHALGRMHDLTAPRKMRLVILESPYAGKIKRNLTYAHLAVRDCVMRGETPYASHIMLTRALDDSIPEQREAGIMAGLVWATVADAVVVYRDFGISNGMRHAIAEHKRHGRIIEYRNILERKESMPDHVGEMINKINDIQARISPAPVRLDVGSVIMEEMKKMATYKITNPNHDPKHPKIDSNQFYGIALVESAVLPPNGFAFLNSRNEIIGAGTIKKEEKNEN